MKKLMRAAVVALALALSLALASVAFADEETTTYSITIKNDAKGHTYEAYQIFTGVVSDGDVLSDIAWGKGVSSEGQNALMQKYGVESVGALAKKLDNSNAVEFAGIVGDYLTTPSGSDEVKADAEVHDNMYVISDLTPGYYLVKDSDSTLGGSYDAYTSYIVCVVGNVEANPKSDVPTVEKKVKDINDSTGVATDWQDSADYDIGDAVPFQLTAELANNVTSYDEYKIVFHDTLAKGLTYNNNAVVKMGETVVTGFFDITATTNNDGTTTLTVSCDDVTTDGFGAGNSAVITVEYTATLNENAEIGAAGNPNEVYLEFSNDPNAAPGNGSTTGPSGETEPSTGTTPDDVVKVFCYQIMVNKVDDKGNAVSGAGFTLYKKASNGEFKAVGVELKHDDSVFTWEGLDDGDYKLVESSTPPGYNTADDILFTISAEHDVVNVEPELKELTASVDQSVAVEFEVTKSTGVVKMNVVNTPGVNLPSTGGIGTTYFYVVGGILMAVGCALVARRLLGGRES